MPNCGCKDQCSCIIRAGSDNVQLTGSGSIGDPYYVAVEKPTPSDATVQTIDSHLGGDATNLVPQVVNHDQQIVDLENSIADTGWVDVTVNSGFAFLGGYSPQVRRIGKVVHFRGAWLNAGLAAASTEYSVGALPGGFYPTRDLILPIASSNAPTQGRGRITTTGDVRILTNTTIGGYYVFQTHWVLD